MRFAKWVFTIAGIYGLLAVAPMYFLENTIARMSTPINHPEYFYGFIGVTVAFQLVFLIMGRDPVRHRALIPACIVEKISFGAAIWPLFLMGRVPTSAVALSTIDLVLAVLFAISWVKTSGLEATGRRR
jgi:hypothetical protein